MYSVHIDILSFSPALLDVFELRSSFAEIGHLLEVVGDRLLVARHGVQANLKKANNTSIREA